MISIHKVIEHVVQIAEGYMKWLYDVVTGNGSADSVRRLKICRECPHNRHGICNICGCILKVKVRVDYPLDDEGKSVDGCPGRRW
jgi:hypothetical protein